MVNKKVAIVILNYKVKDEVIECLNSIKKSTYKNLNVIVIDNASNDGLDQAIKSFPQITYIQNSSNLGYTGGNNIGIKKALEMRTDYVLVLNPDTIIDKDSIANLLKVAEDEGAGISGPKILFGDRKTIWYAGGLIDLNNILGVHRGVDEKDQGRYDEVRQTEFVSGAAIFIRSDIFDKIGLFDERYFLYLEDLEFCFRAKMKNIKILYNPKAVVYHKNAKSTGLGSPLQDYYISRNRLLFAFTYLSLKKRLALLKHIITTMYLSTRRQALFDFMIGNLGKGSFR